MSSWWPWGSSNRHDEDDEDIGGSSAYGGSAAAASSSSSKSHLYRASCCKRLCTELNPCQPWFSVADPTTGRKIDVPESFAPASCFAFIWKLITFGTSVFTLVWGLLQTDYPKFYLAYLTNWGVVITILYTVVSLRSTICAGRLQQPPEAVPRRLRWGWVLFEIAANWEMVVAVLYWYLLWDPSSQIITYNNFAPHALLGTLVLIDGLIVNRIPVRWMHWYGFVLPAETAWLVWSILHMVFDIGNPENSDNDPTTNDDAIYDFLDWKNNTAHCVVVSLISLLVISPLAYLIMWLCSLYSLPCCCAMENRRRYLKSTEDDNDGGRQTQLPSRIVPEDGAVEQPPEERSIFALWG